MLIFAWPGRFAGLHQDRLRSQHHTKNLVSLNAALQIWQYTDPLLPEFHVKPSVVSRLATCSVGLTVRHTHTNQNGLLDRSIM